MAGHGGACLHLSTWEGEQEDEERYHRQLRRESEASSDFLRLLKQTDVETTEKQRAGD